MIRRWGLATIAVSACFLVTGCAPEPANVVAVPTQTPSQTPTAEATTPSESNVDLDKEFRKIVDASCDKASDVGVTETLVGQDRRLVWVPESEAYNDFTAAAVNDTEGIAPIWSSEVFAVCIDAINFSMLEEGGSTYAITVSGDLAAGTLHSEYTLENYGTFITDYVIVDGLIIGVTSETPASTTVKTIRYGMPSMRDIEHFREAIDEFLASE